MSAQQLTAREQEIQAATNQMWDAMHETIVYYNSLACPCAFPRFIQYVQIDCVDTRSSFYMSETEGFIYAAKECYEEKQVDKHGENYNAICTCKKCGSTFEKGWSDFSIHVSRTFMKPLELKIKPVGAAAVTPIPFHVGLFGHALPDRAGFNKMTLQEFCSYIKELA